MIYFHNDYNAMGCDAVLNKMNAIAQERFGGYGMDTCCEKAAAMIRCLCGAEEAQVHFLVGGTQTNLTVIAASLRPHQGVIGAETAHIHVHETGAIEATGHKVIALPCADGKLTAAQVEEVVVSHRTSVDKEHMAQPKMVYISNSTEVGTVYTKAELEELSRVCRKYGLFLFMDGARLSYALTAADSDVTLEDLARLCDVFYLGGTKCGAMFGEAVVITNPAIAEDFRYMIKQRGGMLAKGWLLGAQFEALLEDGLYFSMAEHANRLADRIRQTLETLGHPFLAENRTNQVFPILPDSMLEKLGEEFTFAEMGRVDDTHRAVRFCTSWASKEEDVAALCGALQYHSENS